MKVKAYVNCSFEIEYDDDNSDVRLTTENIEMNTVKQLIELETSESVQMISVEYVDKI